MRCHGEIHQINSGSGFTRRDSELHISVSESYESTATLLSLYRTPTVGNPKRHVRIYDLIPEVVADVLDGSLSF